MSEGLKVTYKKLYGSDIKKYLNDIAKLRIEVFREYPYLYDGDLEYEKKYLSRYLSAKNSLITLAICDSGVIGATSCIPLSEEESVFKKAFKGSEYDINRIFYFGESIILKEYRGKGIGSHFFTIREEHARSTIDNLQSTCFCAVQRHGHPLTPPNYKPLDQFWQKKGYRKNDSLFVEFPWKDIDKDIEDNKKLVFWIKNWST